jgi:hypothetical protein
MLERRPYISCERQVFELMNQGEAMKPLGLAALLFIATVHLQAQNAPAPARASNTSRVAVIGRSIDDDAGDDAEQITAVNALARYTAAVDGLLRDYNQALQEITHGITAGDVDEGQAEQLKLQATQMFTARLETLSAVYESVVNALEDQGSDDGGAPDDSTAPANVVRTKFTVRVQELQQKGSDRPPIEQGGQ